MPVSHTDEDSQALLRDNAMSAPKREFMPLRGASAPKVVALQ